MIEREGKFQEAGLTHTKKLSSEVPVGEIYLPLMSAFDIQIPEIN